MRKIFLDKHTKEQAIEYANNEAEIRGFPQNSEKWKSAFKDYLTFAVGTLSVGRNPRNFRYKVYATLYPDIFGADGFCGKAAKNYQSQDGSRGISLTDAQSRVLSSVMNLTKLFENGILGIKNTTTGNKQGKIDNKEVSELQLPNKEGMNDDEYEALVRDVIHNWLVRDVVTNAILESLMPFFTMDAKEVEEIMAALNARAATLKDVQTGRRAEMIKSLRAVTSPTFKRINYKKLIVG